MTLKLNGVMNLILVISRNLVAFGAHCVKVIEDTSKHSAITVRS